MIVHISNYHKEEKSVWMALFMIGGKAQSNQTLANEVGPGPVLLIVFNKSYPTS